MFDRSPRQGESAGRKIKVDEVPGWGALGALSEQGRPSGVLACVRSPEGALREVFRLEIGDRGRTLIRWGYGTR